MFVERSSLLRGLGALKDSDTKTSTDSSHPEEPLSITGLETFSLSCKIRWPFSIVISRRALVKSKLIFHSLFYVGSPVLERRPNIGKNPI
ncbi:hypothetical protein SLE2022_059490 [Rubroshorea leprosula]